jgi:hypothetical protein
VLLVVAPKGDDMTFVEKICDSVGQGTCVVRLNARLETARFPVGESQEAFFLETFEPVFQLKPPPTQARCDESFELRLIQMNITIHVMFFGVHIAK